MRSGLVIAAAALVVAGAWKYQRKASSPSAEAPAGLNVSPERLDFGEVWEDSRFAWVLPIENRSASDISIERFLNNCVCTEMSPASLVVPAGQSRDLHLTLDLTRVTEEDIRKAEAVRDFEVAVTAIVAGGDGGRARPEWEVRGRVKTAIQFEQPLVDFGRRSERAQPLPRKRAIVKALAPVDGLAVTGNPDGFLVQVHRLPEDPSRFALEIVPKAGLPLGSYRFDLSVAPVLAGGKRLPPKTLPVVAWVVPDLEASPPEVVFGTVPVGESIEATVTLQSLTNQAFTVEGWRCPGDQVRVERQANDGGAPTFRIKWLRVSEPGSQQAEVVFQTAVGKEFREVVVPVKCYGMSRQDRKPR